MYALRMSIINKEATYLLTYLLTCLGLIMYSLKITR